MVLLRMHLARSGQGVPRRFARGPFAALFLLSAGLSLTATAARADIPMFLVISMLKFNAFPILVIVILIEAIALQRIYAFGAKVSVMTSILANGFSLILGIILYPVLGGLLYPFVAPLVLATIGGSAAIELIVTLIGVSIVDTVIELPFIARLRKVRITLRAAAVFLAANVLGMVVMAAAIIDYDDLFDQPIPSQDIARLESHYAAEIDFMQQIFDEVATDFADDPQLRGPDWETLKARITQDAAQYRFRRLAVIKVYSHSIVFGYGGEDGLHSTAARRGEGRYRRDNIEVWKTMSQDGVWYYVYDIRASWQPRSLMVRAWFDPV